MVGDACTGVEVIEVDPRLKAGALISISSSLVRSALRGDVDEGEETARGDGAGDSLWMEACGTDDVFSIGANLRSCWEEAPDTPPFTVQPLLSDPDQTCGQRAPDAWGVGDGGFGRDFEESNAEEGRTTTVAAGEGEGALFFTTSCWWMLGAEEDFMVVLTAAVVDEGVTSCDGAGVAPNEGWLACVESSEVFLILFSSVAGNNCGDCDLRTELTGTLQAGWAGGGAGWRITLVFGVNGMAKEV